MTLSESDRKIAETTAKMIIWIGKQYMAGNASKMERLVNEAFKDNPAMAKVLLDEGKIAYRQMAGLIP